MLHRLIYVSASRVSLPQAEVAQLLAGSRLKNADIDVTGLLLYHDGSFVQVIEGPADKVSALFETIRNDPRHSGVITLWSGPVTSRVFPDWRMGFASVEDLPPPLRETVFSLRDVSQAPVADLGVTLLLNRFLAGFRDLPPARFAN